MPALRHSDAVALADALADPSDDATTYRNRVADAVTHATDHAYADGYAAGQRDAVAYYDAAGQHPDAERFRAAAHRAYLAPDFTAYWTAFRDAVNVLIAASIAQHSAAEPHPAGQRDSTP